MNIKNTIKEKNYWDSFYDGFSFDIPSQFCTLTATEVCKKTAIVEFGCGNGRDSIFFARHGYSITAMDLSSEAIKKNLEKTSNMKGINFLQGDVVDHKSVTQAINTTRTKKEESLVVYSRFFLHTLNQPQEDSFISSLDQILIKGDKLYFEFRSKEDASIDKVYGEHYRRFIDNDKFVENIEVKHNFDIEYNITGQGMAKYNAEDPFVTRIIAVKR